MTQSTPELENLFAQLFIARQDVKAYQAGPGKYQGSYFTHTQGPRDNPTYLPWSRAAIAEHINGQATYGHYLLNQNSECKLMAFDLDLKKETPIPTLPMPEADDESAWETWQQHFNTQDAREAWHTKGHPAQAWMRYAMRSLAHVIQTKIETLLDVPTAVAYTGSKGLHVYGFTGKMPAKEVRVGSQIVLDSLPIRATRGKMIFEWFHEIDNAGMEEHEIMTIECFPKQDTIDPDGFGNLMRLPLGRNQKSGHPTFFVNTDLGQVPLGQMRPTDPIEVLTRALERV